MLVHVTPIPTNLTTGHKNENYGTTEIKATLASGDYYNNPSYNLIQTQNNGPVIRTTPTSSLFLKKSTYI